MKKTIFSSFLALTAVAAFGLPTYEPFTEFGNLVATSGSNLVVTSQGVAIGTNASTFISGAIDLPNGDLTDPSGETWTALHFGGLNSSSQTNGAYHGLDAAVISNSAIFTASALASLLPATFPGFPTGEGIDNLVENPAQPLIWNGTAYASSASTVGDSPVLTFSRDIVRPATGSQTIYVSYLLSVAQQGQLGSGNDGRYLAFLSQSNLVAGIGTANTYSNWWQLFNTYGATAPKYAAHGLLSKTAGSTFYIGPCDTSAGKDFSTSLWTGSYGVPLFVVGAYQLSSGVNDTNAMWVNPPVSSFGGLQPPAGTGAVQIDVVPAANRPPDIAGLALIDRVGSGASGGVGTNYIANLIVGTTWSYVTGGPEFTSQPATNLSANVGQNITLTGAATAAGQSIAYQWQKISGGITNVLSDGAGAAGGTGTVAGSQTSTLSIVGLGIGDVGSYQLVATASGTGYALGSGVSAVALTDPQIVSSPTNVAEGYGQTAVFTAQVTTANGPLTYEWYHDGVALDNGSQADGSSATGASGTTAAGTVFTLSLSLSGVSYQDSGDYTLYVTNNSGLSGATVPAALTVIDPGILTQPASPAVAAGGNAIFNVAAVGSPTLDYQWYEDGNVLSDGSTTVGGTAVVSGSQTATLTLTGVSDADDGDYYCTVSGSASGQSTNSASATLTVQDPLIVVSAPRSLVERAGDHVAFVAGVSGGGPQFQWNFNGSPITGATNSALVLTNVQAANTGTYAVTVYNQTTAARQLTASLTVVTNALFPLAATNLIVARVGDGVQALSGATGNTLYLDQYTPAGNYVSTLQIPDEAVAAPYGAGSSASIGGSPALIFQGAGDDAPTSAFLTRSGGDQEFISVAGYCLSYPFSGSDVTVGATGGAYWRGLADINAFGVYTLAYTNTGLYSGGNHTIRSAVTLDGVSFWTTGQAGANGVKYVNADVASYATGSGIPTITSSATGTEVVQVINGNLVFSDATVAAGGLYITAGIPEPLPANNDASSQLLSETSYPIDFAFSPDLNTVYIADGAGFGGTNAQAGGIERWDTNVVTGGYTFSYALPVDPSQTLGAAGVAVDFSAASTWGPGVTGAKIFATTYGSVSNSLVSLVDSGLNSTPVTLVTAGAQNALRGVRFGPAAVSPSVLTGPVSQTNFPGNSVTFSVTAAGSAPLYYQWYGPAGLLADATNSVLTVNGINYASAGGYYVVVSNPTGTNAVSNAGVLTVTEGKPTITPSGLPNYQETAGDHLAWAPTIDGSTPLTYNWYKNGSPTPVAGGTITNLGAGNGGLVLANIQPADSGTYSLVVANIYGSATNIGGGTLTVTTGLQPLSPTNLVVARIGDGAQPLSAVTGNTLYLDQYTPAGQYVSTIQIPDQGAGAAYGTGGDSSADLPTNSQPLLVVGAGADAPYEGILTLAPNGQSLTFGGYVEAYPFSGADVTTGANGGVNWRGIAEVDAYGFYTLAYTNSGLYSGGYHQIHSAVDSDGSGADFYTTGEAGGGNGIKYLSADFEPASGLGLTSVGGSFSGTRVAQVVGGNLLFSDAGASLAGLYAFSGLPTAAATATLILEESNSPVDFAVSPDQNTIYIADNGAFEGTGTPAGGIQRWDGTSGSYTYSYTLATGSASTVGARALAVDFSAQSTWGAGVTGANLFVVTAEPSGNRLVAITDVGASSSANTLATAAAGQLLSGIRFGPSVVAPYIVEQPESTNAPVDTAVVFSAAAGGSGPFTYQWYFQSNGAGAGVAINGATNSSFSINSVTSANVGNYYVIASNPSLATAQSETASLGLLAPPQFLGETYLGAGQGFGLTFTGPSGSSYSLYTTTNLALGSAGWTLLTTGTFSGSPASYTDANGGNNPQQFYLLSTP
jgi:hypothetical protein